MEANVQFLLWLLMQMQVLDLIQDAVFFKDYSKSKDVQTGKVYRKTIEIRLLYVFLFIFPFE